MKIGVVGAGLFGSIVAQRLRMGGIHKVVVFDDHRPMRGSAPAACLIKPGWVSSMSKEDLTNSLDLLDNLYGVQDIEFVVNGLVKAIVHWVDPRKILREPDIKGKVTGIFREHGKINLQVNQFIKPGEQFPTMFGPFDRVVLCCGSWARELIGQSMPPVVGQVGQASSYLGQVEQPTIDVWAPYKQLVRFNRTENEVWVGDGAAIKHENWGQKHILANIERCDRISDHLPVLRRQTGIRPYIKDAKPCYLESPTDGLWVLTGGAKNGTIAAAWAAVQLGGRI
jgi:glycine/D-amino acid oxidase-like deaminating enzyme